MSEITKVYYPFEDAVYRAAKQNFEHHVNIGLEERFPFDELHSHIQETYLEEARTLLMRKGENTEPIAPHTEHICVKDFSRKAFKKARKELGKNNV